MSMPVAKFYYKGDWSKTIRFLDDMKRKRFLTNLDKYGKLGVDALSRATPVDTGKTAASWYYEIEITDYGAKITWSNSNVVKDWANVAIMLQYGHGTRNGGYVQGIDYINPAMRPIFEKIADAAWEEVKKS